MLSRLRQQGHSISFIRLRSTSTMRSIFVPAAIVHLLVLAVVFLRSEHAAADSYRWTRSLPSLPDQDALQWLSTRSTAHRWYKQPSPDQPSEENARTLKRLQLVNENGIEQFHSGSSLRSCTATVEERLANSVLVLPCRAIIIKKTDPPIIRPVFSRVAER
jgi:hypothetical protein